MLIEISQVHKVYARGESKVTALDDVSLSFDAGQFLAVTGPSGCGKSTLLLTLGGLLRPSQGEVRIDTQSLYDLSANARAELRARKIGFVFQQFYLVPYLNVVDNILSATLGPTELTASQKARRVGELVEQLGLNGRQRHRPHELSVGERQRVALARAMFNGPQLLLADEPTGNLDRQNADTVLDFLVQFRSGGGAVMLVTHDPAAAARADRQITMSQGRISA